MKYSASREWVEVESHSGSRDDRGNHMPMTARVGITHIAQKELGNIVYVELPKLGSQVDKQQEAAVLESTKAAVDVYSPVSGQIVEVNTQLVDHPELINQFPETQGWIYKIALAEASELDQLMDAEGYLTSLRSS